MRQQSTVMWNEINVVSYGFVRYAKLLYDEISDICAALLDLFVFRSRQNSRDRIFLD